ncbi:hypothetical protein GPALN_012570 [Globodera pallida]|nr:hypothetical protein GPALN_012570 [Globodera pallida]
MTDHQPDTNKRRTRRSLFGSGRPNDTDEWLRNLENNAMDEKVRQWNFDFRRGRPLKKAGVDSPSSSHVYEAVDEREVPEFYRTKTIRPVTASRPSVQDQMSPRKPPLKPSESLKTEATFSAKEESEADAALFSPRKSKRLRKANSTESTPQKKKKRVG